MAPGKDSIVCVCVHIIYIYREREREPYMYNVVGYNYLLLGGLHPIAIGSQPAGW